jgi:tRNA(Ile)-lysidine synthase
VLPYLREYNDKLPESLNRLADMMKAEDDWMEAEARKRFAELVEVGRASDGIECSLGATRFATLHVALQRRLIKLILNYVFLDADLSDYARIEAVRSVIGREQGESISLDLHDRLKLIREYDTVRFVQFVQAWQPPEPYEYFMENPDALLLLPEAGAELESSLIEAERESPAVPPWGEPNGHLEARFDYDLLPFPLTVRSRRPGDRMEPLGLKGTKKVKDMFIDKKVPPAARGRVPLVLDAAGRIIWIPGVRRSTHATVSETTTRVLVMRVRSV